MVSAVVDRLGLDDRSRSPSRAAPRLTKTSCRTRVVRHRREALSRRSARRLRRTGVPAQGATPSLIFDGFRAVGEVRYASPEVGPELVAERQEVRADSRRPLERRGGLSRRRVEHPRATKILDWRECALTTALSRTPSMKARGPACRREFNLSQPTVQSGGGSGSRQLARTGYQLLGASDSFGTDALGVRPCTSVLCAATI